MLPNNPYIENAEKWINLAGIDYITQFVKAWISFNAWYKNSYPNLESDSAAISEIMNSPNIFRNRVEALLTGSGPEHLEFKAQVARLHQKLEDNQIYNRGARISFTFVDFGHNPNSQGTIIRYRCTFTVERGPIDPATGNRLDKNHILCSIQNSRGIVIFRHLQTNGHNIRELMGLDSFQDLSLTQQNCLAEVYEKVHPRRTESLISDGQRYIEVGGLRLKDDVILLCQGIIALLYQLRNALFHGQIIPNNATTMVYEPAYHILYALIQNLR